MELSSRKTIARFILTAYMLAGVLLEVGHHDIHAIRLIAAPAVSSHNCGANEIHIPLDRRHECLVCTHSTQRVATATTSLPADITAFLCFGHLFITNERTLHTDILHSGKRGPPVS